MTDKKFQEALLQAGKIVESWPTWKQTSLLVTMMATSPTPRQPIDQVPSSQAIDCNAHPTPNVNMDNSASSM